MHKNYVKNFTTYFHTNLGHGILTEFAHMSNYIFDYLMTGHLLLHRSNAHCHNPANIVESLNPFILNQVFRSYILLRHLDETI